VPCPKCNEPKQYQSSVCKTCFSQKLDANGNWKGGKVVHKKGYIMVKVNGWTKNNGYKFEHILVMEQSLGRELLPGENVHHLNGIRSDNRLENLELWVKPQPTGVRVTDAVIWAEEILRRYKSA
jgi:HNH endonuclease